MSDIKCSECYYCFNYNDGTNVSKCIPFDKDVYSTNTVCDDFIEELSLEVEQ